MGVFIDLMLPSNAPTAWPHLEPIFLDCLSFLVFNVDESLFGSPGTANSQESLNPLLYAAFELLTAKSMVYGVDHNSFKLF